MWNHNHSALKEVFPINIISDWSTSNQTYSMWSLRRPAYYLIRQQINISEMRNTIRITISCESRLACISSRVFVARKGYRTQNKLSILERVWYWIPRLVDFGSRDLVSVTSKFNNQSSSYWDASREYDTIVLQFYCGHLSAAWRLHATFQGHGISVVTHRRYFNPITMNIQGRK